MAVAFAFWRSWAPIFEKLRDQVEVIGLNLHTIESGIIAFMAALPKSATVSHISAFVIGRGATVGFLPDGVTLSCLGFTSDADIGSSPLLRYSRGEFCRRRCSRSVRRKGEKATGTLRLIRLTSLMCDGASFLH